MNKPTSRELRNALEEVYDPQDAGDEEQDCSEPSSMDRAQFASAVVVGLCILGALGTCALKVWA